MSGFRKARAEQAALKLALYGAPGCLDGETHVQYHVRSADGRRQNQKGGTLAHLYERFSRVVKSGKGYYQRPGTIGANFTLPCMTEDGTVRHAKIQDVVASGRKPCVTLETERGHTITATEEHAFFSAGRYLPAFELREGMLVALRSGVAASVGLSPRPRLYRAEIFVKHHPVAAKKIIDKKYTYHRLRKSRAVIEASMNGLTLDNYIARLNEGELLGLSFLPRSTNVHHADEDTTNDALENLILIDHSKHAALHSAKRPILFSTRDEKITKIKISGTLPTYDVLMPDPDHNYLANDFVVHNSGKTLTSLLLADGLAALDGKRVAFFDTERGTDFYCQAVPSRAVHPEAFDFDALYTRSIMEVRSEVKNLDPAKYSVVIIDSITHLWEAARAAYVGKQTKIGSIPFHAWAAIKKPYKDILSELLSSPMHVIICGRQGTEYATDDETDELKAIGFKMKAEGETAYEPHILIRMEAIKPKSTNALATIVAYAEKDRTGVLSGRSFVSPTFDSICKPLLGLLGRNQAQIKSSDEVANDDAEAIEKAEHALAAQSEELLRTFSARIELADSAAALKKIGEGITPALKAKMLPADLAGVRERYHRRMSAVPGNGEISSKKVTSPKAAIDKAGVAVTEWTPHDQDTGEVISDEMAERANANSAAALNMENDPTGDKAGARLAKRLEELVDSAVAASAAGDLTGERKDANWRDENR